MLRIGVGRSLFFALVVTSGGLASAQMPTAQYPPLVPPGQPRRGFDPALHQTPGSRGLGTIRRVVLHTIEGPASSAVNWFKNPDSSVSAHYVIDFDGSIGQMVLEKDSAWHVRGHNSDTIGIEHAGYARRNQWTQAQIMASARLVAEICSDYNIQPSTSTIVSHAALDPARRSDPGAFFPWGQYLAQVQQIKLMIDTAKMNGTPVPPADMSGLSTRQGSANPNGTEFADASVDTGATGGNEGGAHTHGGSGLGEAVGDAIGDVAENALTDAAGQLIDRAIDGLTGGGQAGAQPSGATARGTGSIDGGYDTLVESSGRAAPQTSGSAATSGAAGGSTPAGSPAGDDTVAASAPRGSTGGGRITAGSPDTGARTAPPTADNPDPAADDAEPGSSYGGFTRRDDGFTQVGDRSRSRGGGEPGDARKQREGRERSSSKRDDDDAQAELDREVGQALATLQRLGYKRVAAAGILASLIEESNLNTSVIEGSLQDVRAAGVGYWIDDDLDGLWEAAARQGVDWDLLDFQLEYLDGELARDFASMRRRLRQARSPETAARIFASGLFELDRRDHGAELDRRAELAREIFEGRLGSAARTQAYERSSERTTRRAEPQARPATRWDDY